jgi:flagellar hook-associated protein 3 FlgL
MRVTNKMMADNITAQLFRQTKQMAETQEHIITGKRINRASDDPAGISSALSYYETISSLEQYDNNIANGKLHIDIADDILDMVTDLLGEAKEISFDSAPNLRTELAADVAEVREQVLQMANHQIDGNYLFSGDATDTEPFSYDPVGLIWRYNGDSGTKDVIIGENMTVNLTADGSAIFGPDGGNVLDVLDALESALTLPDPVAIKNQIAPLDSAMDRLNAIRARNAGVYKRLEATENHYAYFKINVEEMLSKTEDADVAEAIINFKVQQTTYESTLATSSMILQKSLIDFLR